MILAAGRGVRMKSSLPKVLHEVAGRPMLDRVLDGARHLGGRAVLVVGAGREEVVAHVHAKDGGIAIAVQDPPRGTGDAVRCAVPHLGDAGRVVVLSGDVPLLENGTLDALLAQLDAGYDAAFLTAILPDAGSYGRVVRDGAGQVTKIVEAKDASREELALHEINAGIYAFERGLLESALPRLSADNAQGELYLTDVIGLAIEGGRRVAGLPVADPDEVLGVNSRADLARLDSRCRTRAAEKAMAAGATLLRPETITLDDEVTLGEDVVVEPFVTLLGKTSVGPGTRIGQGSVIRGSTLAGGVTLKPYCVLEGAIVGAGAVVGPFARLREGTDLAEDVHVGNFVETKKARLERGVKANHLTYLGDVTVGERTNVGAGVITCNYDGFSKHHTTIGRDVFVGSDTQLVAPVVVGDGAMLGAGTTVTDDVPENALAVSRAPQRNLAGLAERIREKKRAEKAARKATA